MTKTPEHVATWTLGPVERALSIHNPKLKTIRADERSLVPLERDEGRWLTQWYDKHRAGRGVPFVHVPNELPHTNVRGRQLLKAQGLRAGYPDYLVDAARWGWNGLRIELKRSKGGAHSQDQKAMQAQHLSNGYLSIVACGWRRAAAWVAWYLTDHGRDGMFLRGGVVTRTLPMALDAYNIKGTGELYPWMARKLELAPIIEGEK